VDVRPSVGCAIRSTEMRDRTILDWVALIQAEYREVPGLKLTKPQVRRMWSLDEELCDTLLDTLLEAQVLRMSANAYVRHDLGCC
jgi:hypothetical protein